MKRYIWLFLLAITGCSAVLVYTVPNFAKLYGPSAPINRLLTAEEVRQNEKLHRVSYHGEIKPLLDSRCVVCHSCYDAPCQLQLGSPEGLDRGASKLPVYDTARLESASPTRLFIDAATTAQWREKSFFPVLNERADTAAANLDNSILAKIVQLKRLYPQPTSGKLDSLYDVTYGRSQQCSSVEEFSKFQFEHPMWGMPYAMPGLSLKEEFTLLHWLQEGAKVEPPAALPKQTLAEVARWEAYFNGTTLKQRLVFRYIYEHLFIGHMHFKGHPDQEFFQWVRSKTPPGQPLDIIKTGRPYDAPGTDQFYYRLRHVTETIVDKTHFVYELSEQRMQRYDELFFKSEYVVTTLPSYEPKVAANPFKVYVEIPNPLKYQFLLDESAYFASGFIKGPVCRGGIATDAIRDQFWVFFAKPGLLYSNATLKFLSDNHDTLDLPGEEAEQIGMFGWRKYDEAGKKYLKKKEEFLNLVMEPQQGFGLNMLWDGGGTNPNAALTIFRHYNSATVVQGLVGDTPITGWVMDYPIFERLHYLLVAGFNVYGKAEHQIATRVYMDILRQDAEDNFIRFMPAQAREKIYNSWYLGRNSVRKADGYFNLERESQVQYKTADYKTEFFDLVREKLGKAAGPIDTINRCPEKTCTRPGTTALQQRVDGQLRILAAFKGHELDALPEMALLRVTTPHGKDDLAYTLIINRAHSNISNMIGEDSHRMPENDRMTIFPGFIGCYPNFFFSVDEKDVGEFVEMIRQARSETDLDRLYSRFGIRRTNATIWENLDWFNAQHHLYRGVEAGLLDMNRYENL